MFPTKFMLKINNIKEKSSATLIKQINSNSKVPKRFKQAMNKNEQIRAALLEKNRRRN